MPRPSSDPGVGNLVLVRRAGESIQVGDHVVVTVADIQGGRVRLLIQAPLGVAVDRLEVRASKEAHAETGQ